MVNKEELILYPIIILLVIAMLSMTGLGANTADASKGFGLYNSETSMDNDGNYLYLYDYTGSITCLWNGTGAHADGSIWLNSGGRILKNDYTAGANWRNATGSYALFYDHGTTKPVKWADMTSSIPFITDSSGVDEAKINGEPFSFTDSLSWIVVIGAIMAVGSIVGLKIFGSGESETSVDLLLKGTFFITIWGILTAMAYPLILEAGFWLFLIYFGIALIYTVGVILTIGK